MSVVQTNIRLGVPLGELTEILCGKECFVLVDRAVYGLYKELFPSGDRLFVIEPGEDSKSLANAERILEAMLRANCTRNSTLVAVGGGVAGDLGGFCAAVYMRGIRWVNVPTTLLAQVDSSVGGKTAVNVGSVKNSAGSFHLPVQVLISPDFLKTLPDREWLCGVGEIVKTAFIDEKVYALFAQTSKALIARDLSAVNRLVEACVRFKENIVARDFCETKGVRKILNVGHTLGHAFEAQDGHRRSHGEYVLCGMYAEAYLFREHMYAAVFESLTETVRALVDGLPDTDIERLTECALHDKKNADGGISVMVIEDVGRVCEYTLDAQTLGEKLTQLKRAGEWAWK